MIGGGFTERLFCGRSKRSGDQHKLTGDLSGLTGFIPDGTKGDATGVVGEVSLLRPCSCLTDIFKINTLNDDIFTLD